MADGRRGGTVLLVGVASACVALASCPDAASAQSFTGRITDEATGRAVPTAGVHLLDPEGRAVRSTLADAAGRYDQVILDGPPVLLMSDALVMTGAVDGVILVCRAKKTSRGVFQRAREQIERVNGRIFGAVLNAARVSRGGYFREQIRTFYDYQPEESLQAEAARILPSGGTDEDASSSDDEEDGRKA